MKRILILNVTVIFSIHIGFAEPGGSYTLTGNEKSLEEIVSIDMEQFPNLYKGESLNFYIIKFKKVNKLSSKKLAPGDKLIFPDTKAAIEARKIAQKQRVIGKWKDSNLGTDSYFEYREDGTYIRGSLKFEDTPFFSGIWKIKDEQILLKIKKDHFTGREASTDWIPQEIILLTNTELRTQVKGQKLSIGTRIQ